MNEQQPAWLYAVQDSRGRELLSARHDDTLTAACVYDEATNTALLTLTDEQGIVTAETHVPISTVGMRMHRWPGDDKHATPESAHVFIEGPS